MWPVETLGIKAKFRMKFKIFQIIHMCVFFTDLLFASVLLTKNMSCGTHLILL